MLFLSVLCLAGCAGGNPLAKTRDVFYKPIPATPVTNTVPVYEAEDVLTPAETNLQSGVILPAIPKPGATPLGTVQVVVQPPPKEWDDSENQEAAKGIASTIPVYGGLISTSLLAVFGLGKLWLNRKSPKIIQTTFQSVEAWANAAIASGDPKAIRLANNLKETLAKAHDYADVAADVQKLIDAYTTHSGDASETAEIAKQ